MPAQEDTRRRREACKLTMNRKEAKRKSAHSPGGVKCQRAALTRRMTCPSASEISRALLSPSHGYLTRALSLDDLIQHCLLCFDSEGKLSRNSQLVQMTLMMHNWVVPSHVFAQKLISLYKDCPVDSRGQRRAQICHFIRQWITKIPDVFEADPRLERVMSDLWTLVRKEGEEMHQQLIDTSCLNAPVTPSLAPSPSMKKRKVSLLFDHMEPGELAEHLSYLEFENFRSVSCLDYRSYVVNGSVRGNPALERSVMMCNGVSQWVQLMILSRHTAQQRAHVFTKFIHVAQKLRALQNFNTLMAVMGGLCHSSISRLKDTSSLLPQDITKTLSEMTDLLSSYSNYSNYRRVYSECIGFKVPILGVHLKDLISLNEVLPDYLEDNKINLGKLQNLYTNVNDLLAIHSCKPPFEANKDLLHLLTLSLDLYYTEDEIYELSYAKEPKNPKIQPAMPVKAPVVAEWGSGVTPRIDPDTISKHVKLTVDAIMKNYDHNLDGYISLEDFEKIAASFPFSFCTHEGDREGEISRNEINSYFMRGMSVCAKLGLKFLHNFHETTYKKPTFCNTCRGFLWGVIKQGYRCRDCGVNCHRQCKDQVGMECVRKVKVSGGSCPCTPAPDHRAKGHSCSSEEDNFVFPPSDGAELMEEAFPAQANERDSQRLDRSTQTDPGVWTPGPVNKRGDETNSQALGSSPGKDATHDPKVQAVGKKSRSARLQRSRGVTVPVSILQEKMGDLQLYKQNAGGTG
ncbi:RAS guanyl-releasing protein 1-like [Brienomyrus brachyistius]|uniref:RAS guanyl-releasing protein 1-like n=1 Tax=Brienomyrus brachyistius TaxID=42636 RepID=UPI0020B3D41E|nr:RAS guanyl-releasing protein 1-like [Brienomyrus brachyistius]XP_048840166.1 RAS guanyl-releasing protein 1-like [Brienomyrus brachyistius]XP_048840167.1 RAS guanyl-releasing protein 1-like [Brienomyrus brachyistius]XP_048840168.1 RAS guanyl-releasing protein 1-like [Brienomyrus brachyistius]